MHAPSNRNFLIAIFIIYTERSFQEKKKSAAEIVLMHMKSLVYAQLYLKIYLKNNYFCHIKK